jgi:uncharacterized DUF497 family protein
MVRSRDLQFAEEVAWLYLPEIQVPSDNLFAKIIEIVKRLPDQTCRCYEYEGGDCGSLRFSVGEPDFQVARPVFRPETPWPMLLANVYDSNIQSMIDWTLVTGFDWDEGNARKSAEKHSVSQGEAEQVFFNEPLLLLPDHKHSDHEQRIHALGRTEEDRLLHITFTLRDGGKLIRVISARDMHRKERTIYGEAKKKDSRIENGS